MLHDCAEMWKNKKKRKKGEEIICFCTFVLINFVFFRLTFPALNVNMGRKIIPNLASGTFAQTAARTAMTAPDCGQSTVLGQNRSIFFFVKINYVFKLFYRS